MSSRELLEGIGSPSNPGWQSERLNRITEWAGSNKVNRPIICEYDPDDFWLWTKWRGEIRFNSRKPFSYN